MEASTKAPSPSSSSSKATNTSKMSVDIDNLLADPKFLAPTEDSEFANGRVAVGAAMSFIQELQAALPPQKYQQILSLLSSFYTHSLTVQDVYILVKRVLRGVEGEEALIKGFVKFLPSEAVIEHTCTGSPSIVGGSEESGVGEGGAGVEEEEGKGEEVVKEDTGAAKGEKSG